jgi:hypothetical protein
MEILEVAEFSSGDFDASNPPETIELQNTECKGPLKLIDDYRD